MTVTVSGPNWWYQASNESAKGLSTPGYGSYMGVKFQIGSDWHYGWLRFGPGPALQSTFPTLLEFAYETAPNKSIVIGPQADPLTSSGAVVFALKAFAQEDFYATRRQDKCHTIWNDHAFPIQIHYQHHCHQFRVHPEAA